MIKHSCEKFLHWIVTNIELYFKRNNPKLYLRQALKTVEHKILTFRHWSKKQIDYHYNKKISITNIFKKSLLA